MFGKPLADGQAARFGRRPLADHVQAEQLEVKLAASIRNRGKRVGAVAWNFEAPAKSDRNVRVLRPDTEIDIGCDPRLDRGVILEWWQLPPVTGEGLEIQTGGPTDRIARGVARWARPRGCGGFLPGQIWTLVIDGQGRRCVPREPGQSEGMAAGLKGNGARLFLQAVNAVVVHHEEAADLAAASRRAAAAFTLHRNELAWKEVLVGRLD